MIGKDGKGIQKGSENKRQARKKDVRNEKKNKMLRNVGKSRTCKCRQDIIDRIRTTF
jgi:hypothetical protein